jgi:hypothetical protein
MSDWGGRIENPSGVLVFDSDAAGHTYRGTATRVVSQSSDIYQLFPWVFEYTAPTSAVPIFVVEVGTGSIVCPQGWYRTSGNTWRCEIFSVGWTGSDAQSTLTHVEPVVHVFASGSQPGTWGARLYDSSGNVTYDLERSPLFPREVLNFPQRSGVKNGALAGTGDWNTYQQGDSVARSSAFSKIGVFGGCAGILSTDILSLGEPDITYYYGWNLGSGTLRRARFWAMDNRPFGGSADQNDPDIYRDLNLQPCTAVLIDASIL